MQMEAIIVQDAKETRLVLSFVKTKYLNKLRVLFNKPNLNRWNMWVEWNYFWFSINENGCRGCR